MNFQRDVTKFFTLTVNIMYNIKFYAVCILLYVFGDVISFIFNSVRNYFPVNLLCKFSQILIVKAENDNAIIFVSIFNEGFKSLANIFHCAVVIKVIIFNIGNYSNCRLEFDKGTVTLISLRDKPITFSKYCTCTEISGFTANNDCWINIGIEEYEANHRSSSRLTMSTGNGYTLLGI